MQGMFRCTVRAIWRLIRSINDIFIPPSSPSFSREYSHPTEETMDQVSGLLGGHQFLSERIPYLHQGSIIIV